MAMLRMAELKRNPSFINCIYLQFTTIREKDIRSGKSAIVCRGLRRSVREDAVELEAGILISEFEGGGMPRHRLGQESVVFIEGGRGNQVCGVDGVSIIPEILVCALEVVGGCGALRIKSQCPCAEVDQYIVWSRLFAYGPTEFVEFGKAFALTDWSEIRVAVSVRVGNGNQ